MNENWLANPWLIITVVNKGLARKVVQASREAGASGGTILRGRGTGTREMMRFLGIHFEPEKEVIFTLIGEEKVAPVQEALLRAGKLDSPGAGIAFVIHVCKAFGLSSLALQAMKDNTPGERKSPSAAQTVEGKKEAAQQVEQVKAYELIVTIVNLGDAELVVEASRRAGAEGGTILYGRGTGIHEQARLFGIPIEPEKEVVLTLIPRDQSSQVMQAIMEAAHLNQPGKGIAFILPVERVFGINHGLIQEIQDKISKRRP